MLTDGHEEFQTRLTVDPTGIHHRTSRDLHPCIRVLSLGFVSSLTSHPRLSKLNSPLGSLHAVTIDFPITTVRRVTTISRLTCLFSDVTVPPQGILCVPHGLRPATEIKASDHQGFLIDYHIPYSSSESNSRYRNGSYRPCLLWYSLAC